MSQKQSIQITIDANGNPSAPSQRVSKKDNTLQWIADAGSWTIDFSQDCPLDMQNPLTITAGANMTPVGVQGQVTPGQTAYVYTITPAGGGAGMDPDIIIDT